ncbi:hypothetical protein ACWCOP_01925 [Maricaulaceae bacterium MS644]
MTRRLLILESQPIIGLDLAERVRALGWQACGPYSTTQEALAQLDADAPDAGLLDLSVRDDAQAQPVADAMAARRLPFIFTNSHAKRFEALHPDAPRLEKPFSDGDFLEALARLAVGAAPGRAAAGPQCEPPRPV